MTFVEMLVRRRSLQCVADAMTAQSIRNVSLLHCFLLYTTVQLRLGIVYGNG